MKNLLLINLSYHGQNFHGVQRQKELPTIQLAIETILKEYYRPLKFRFYTASRTDARVHALDQYFLINSTIEYNLEEIQNLFNQKLPKDIKVLSVRRPPRGFDLIAGCRWKEYRYYFTNDSVEPESHYATNFVDHLDFDLMQAACKVFEGKKDFKNYQYRGTIKNTIREVFEVEILEDQYSPLLDSQDLSSSKKSYCIKVRGKGFLRHMVRIMVGAIVNIGKKEITLEQLEKSLQTDSDEFVGFIAPAKGLHLIKIQFDELDSH